MQVLSDGQQPKERFNLPHRVKGTPHITSRVKGKASTFYLITRKAGLVRKPDVGEGVNIPMD
jgi:hypothetical protein